MRQEIKATYVSKFDSPITAYIYDRVIMNGLEDEQADDGFGWSVARVGKRVVYEHSTGFVGSIRFRTVAEAEAAFAEDAAQIADEEDEDEGEE
jgi:hypothetical protein